MTFHLKQEIDYLTECVELIEAVKPFYLDDDDEVWIAFSESRSESDEPDLTFRQWAKRVIAQQSYGG